MKLAVILIIIILSFFINLLYYTCWMLTDHWLMSDAAVTAEVPVAVSSTSSTDPSITSESVAT